ncbi:hypothetical protein MC7420_4796 [Coleofasciculus chthonoplastes PCC 7420]|uniref:Uncharacterized protein n=1 Tax=Coleofasciculus chthonoplastes PCC 7420 TaxID=118168 RepID=B4VN66_9CYAN|nr:hypothetical protein MC7420_4796 [Coleofasciculus chthonoplastes PCC 7420]
MITVSRSIAAAILAIWRERRKYARISSSVAGEMSGRDNLEIKSSGIIFQE